MWRVVKINLPIMHYQPHKTYNRSYVHILDKTAALHIKMQAVVYNTNRQ